VLIASHANFRDVQDRLVQGLSFRDLGLDLPTGTNIVRSELDGNQDALSANTCLDDTSTTEKDESRASLCQRIDYILLAAHGAQSTAKDMAVKRFDDRAWNELPTLSDHAAVAVTLDWDSR
jgi:endonuclease/exonuclease/phosphatase family metal-dependent hydrolase